MNNFTRSGPSFSHVGFHVRDIAKMEDFYKRVMGFIVTDRGEIAPPGNYSFTAEGNVAGKNESLAMLLNTRVDSVTIDPTTHNLMLNTRGMGAVALNAVRRVM